jgi:DNA-directed RNA polymerase subunit RPC12/RpoP
MAIEFPCSRCGRQLRTSEENIGREAKCPECGSLTVIPAVSGGMQAPAQQFTAAPSNNPFASPAIGGQFAQPQYSAASGEVVPTKVSFSAPLNLTWEIFKANLGNCLIFGIMVLLVGLIGIGVTLAITGGATLDPLGQIILLLVILVPSTFFQIGVIRCFIAMARRQDAPLSMIFSGAPWLARGLQYQLIFTGLSILQQLCLFTIGGAIANLLTFIIGVVSFVLTLLFFLGMPLIVDRNMALGDALSTSMAAMSGNKLTLFLLGIVLFIALLLFFVVTLTVGAIAIIPYVALFHQVFYLLATGQLTTRDS